MYHGESNQDFLVLSGECLLLVEGEERLLRAWDFFHSPAWTEHVLVGAGEALRDPRRRSAGAGVERALSGRRVRPSPPSGRRRDDGLAEGGLRPYPENVERPCRDGDLPQT